mgnify:CR=1 FL=1
MKTLKAQQTPKELLPHLFRQEYAKMTAVLCRHFGITNIEIAEDIASETFLKASEYWAVNGVPDNPIAWLHTVAKNKLKDYFKHASVIQKQIKTGNISDVVQQEYDFEFDYKNIEDSQLAMIFAVCNPGISTESQICLALQILCGFSLEEIAHAFLIKTETVKKLLLRARNVLRKEQFKIEDLNKTQIKQRHDTVLRTLYLLFNEGYYSKTSDQMIRKELCSEAVRLTLLLTGNRLTRTEKACALLALMCYQSSRLEARVNKKEEPILFEDQDKSLWDKALIEKGNYYLVSACNGVEVSKYHLEAAIAYWHTTSTDQNKWHHILNLYDQLLIIEPSPITALNRLFAFAKVHGHPQAIAEAERTPHVQNSYYYQLLGYLHGELHTEENIGKAIHNYKKALSLIKATTLKREIQKEITRLSQFWK